MTGLSPEEWVVPPVLGATEPPPLLVAMPEDFAAKAAEAAEEVPYLLYHAANLLDVIHDCLAGAADARLGSMTEVCARAFRDMAAKEGEVVAKLGTMLRRPLAQRLQDRREADVIRQRQEAAHDDHD